MTTDVEAAMRQLEAKDREEAGGVRRALTHSVDAAQRKIDGVRARSMDAISMVGRGGLQTVEQGSALGKLVQSAVMEDVLRALDCFAKVAASRSVVDVYSAQLAYARAQTEANLGRCRALVDLIGASSGAASGVFDATVLPTTCR